MATLQLMLTVAVHRPWRTTLMVFGVNALCLLVYVQIRQWKEPLGITIGFVVAFYLATAG